MLLVGSKSCVLGLPIKQRCYHVIAVEKSCVHIGI
jgi:hypothetical protein